MAVTGKTGADAMFKAVKRENLVISHYGPKFVALLPVLVGLGILTSTEAATVTTFIGILADLQIIIKKMADYSGF